MKKIILFLQICLAFTVNLLSQQGNNNNNQAASTVCQTFVSTDVPVVIPSDALSAVTVSSSNFVSGLSGNITDVNVTDLTGTHTYIWDLVINLEHPDGTTVTLFNQICGTGDFANFDIQFDDAGSPYGNIPCPATDGLIYQPFESLSAFNGKPADGTWTLNITDLFPPDGGLLQSWSVEICTDAVLPLSLLDFSAEYISEKEEVALDWQVADINNVSHFEIWRSNAENNTFVNIGQTELFRDNEFYYYTDNDIKLGQTYYYKLKVVDYDDSFNWSKISTISTGEQTRLAQFFPNPFSNNLSIEFNQEEITNIQLNLYDITGRLIRSVDNNHSEITNWNLSDIESGTYIIEFVSPFNREVQRIIKM